MIILHDDTGSLEALKANVDTALRSSQTHSLLIMVCDENAFTHESLDPLLTEIQVPVFGGIFPVVLFQQEQMRKGSIVVGMSAPSEIHFIPGLSDPEADYEQYLDDVVGDDAEVKTVITFVDGLSTRIASFIDALYSIFGLELNYVGGGAGSLSFEQKPCIITNDGLKEDGGVVATFPIASGVGVSHGWETISGPYKVTEAEGNIVKTLDWRPAFDVYREAVENHSGFPFDSNDFFNIAKAYPFGIARMESERIVRDIFMVNENSHLECVAEIPEGDYIDILHGNPTDLIMAASEAFDKAREHFTAKQIGLEILIDCISRVLFLEGRFTEEMNAVTHDDIPMIGACTIGEIANSGKDYLEFYNKTTVVAFWEKA